MRPSPALVDALAPILARAFAGYEGRPATEDVRLSLQSACGHELRRSADLGELDAFGVHASGDVADVRFALAFDASGDGLVAITPGDSPLAEHFLP